MIKNNHSGYNAVIETVKANYFIQLIKIGRGKRVFEAYQDGDLIFDWNARDGKKTTFKRILETFRIHRNIGSYSFMDY